MQSEPERPVEKLLRDAALKRREGAGAPFELHPATRRLLQGEVTRQFPQKPASPTGSWFALFWPRAALTGAAVVALLVGVFAILPSRPGGQPQLMAKNEPAPETSSASAARGSRSQPTSAEEEPAPTASPVTARDALAAADTPRIDSADTPQPKVTAPYAPRSRGAEKRVLTLQAEGNLPAGTAPGGATPIQAPATPTAPARAEAVVATTAFAPTAGSRPAAADPARPQSNFLADAATDAESKPVSREVASFSFGKAAKTPTQRPVGLNEADAAASFSQRADFVTLRTAGTQLGLANREFAPTNVIDASTADKGARLPSSSGVLASFTLEQTGQELRAVDRDGSVYAGPLQFPQDLYRRKLSSTSPTAAPATATARPSAAQGTPAAAYFFRLTGTNRSLNQRVVFTGSLLPANPLTGATGVPPLLNSRISGRLLVGEGTSPIEINAVPAKP